MNDARLGDLYQRMLTERSGRARERCAAPEAIQAVIRREGSEEQRLEILDHVMSCSACRSEFDLLRTVEEAGAELVGRPALSWRRRWPWLTPAAVAASLVVVSTFGWLLTRGGPDALRGAGGDVELLTPPAGDVEAGAPVTFAWKPVDDARRYELEVLDLQGRVVFALATLRASTTLSDLGRLRPGTSYRWRVRATTSSGVRPASALRSLRLRSP